ncbi:MAG: class A sortase [Streptococcaceae bacterium]|nr:class A sortase [Streptococcaceae bacterium]MCL2681190.1 class A sortase [Streptococcaceae bacterium]
MEEENKAKKKKKGNLRYVISNIIFVLLIVISLFLMFNKGVRNMLIANTSNKYQIANVTREQIVENKATKEGNFNFGSVTPVNVQNVLNQQFSPTAFPVIGAIAIPDLNMNLPIFLGLDSGQLQYGAGTMKANQVMGQGNYALASHNVTGYDADLSLLFTPLEHAKDGMMIYLTDRENVYQYKITSKKIVTPNHVEVIDDVPGKKMVTLVTCADPEAIQRIIVQGELTGQMKFSDMTDSQKKAFQKVTTPEVIKQNASGLFPTWLYWVLAGLIALWILSAIAHRMRNKKKDKED